MSPFIRSFLKSRKPVYKVLDGKEIIGKNLHFREVSWFLLSLHLFSFKPAAKTIEPYIKRIDIQNFFKLLGNLTYSLYLLHLPVQIIFLLVFTYLNIPDNIFIKDYFLILFFVTIIISSYHCFRIYEKPLNKNIRKILKNKI